MEVYWQGHIIVHAILEIVPNAAGIGKRHLGIFVIPQGKQEGG